MDQNEKREEQQEVLENREVATEAPAEAAAEVSAEVATEAPAEAAAAEEAPAGETGLQFVPPVMPQAVPPQPVTAGPKQIPSPEEKKKKLFVIGAAAVAGLVVLLILFFAVIRPNMVYAGAVKALDRKDFTECQRLLDTIPTFKKTPALRVDLAIAQARAHMENGNLEQADAILRTLDSTEAVMEAQNELAYRSASAAVAAEKFDEAKEFLAKLPENYSDKEQLREKVKYNDALQSIENGDYETAYQLFTELGDFEDAADQKEKTYMEALTVLIALKIQPKLKNPASLRLTSITFYENENDNTQAGELACIVEATGSNSYGGTVGGYYCVTAIYKDIKENDLNPLGLSHSSYNDPSTYVDILAKLIINAVKEKEEFKTNVDVARVNRLLEAHVTFKVDLDFVPQTGVEI